MDDLTNRDLIFCSACRANERMTPLRLASVGFLSKMRAVSYTCEACGHVTAVSLRRGAFVAPEPDVCWNCAVPFAPGSERCASCEADPRPRSARPAGSARSDGVFFTYAAGDLGALAGRPRAALEAALDEARAARDLEEALRAADALTYAFPADAPAWRRKADLYLEWGFLPLALHAWKQAIAAEPGRADDLLALSNVLQLLEEPDDALAAAARAEAIAPADARPPAARAALLERLERFDEARAAALHAIAVDPARSDAWSTIATLDMRRKAWPDAARAWERALAASTDFPLGWRYKGLCHLALGEWDAAADAALRAGTADDDALELAVEAELGKGDTSAAVAAADRALALRAKDTRFLYLRARALMAAERYQDGIAVMDEILAIDPEAGWAKKARGVFAERL